MNIRDFIADETGAVTVDWVVLAAACLVVGVGVSDVMASAMEEFSSSVRAELTNTDPSRNYFDEIMNRAIFGEYTTFSESLGSEWNEGGRDMDGNTWAQAAYNVYAAMDNQALLDQYEFHYDIALNGDVLNDDLDAQSLDHIAVTERVLLQRGVDLPEGNMTAAEVRATYEAPAEGV